MALEQKYLTPEAEVLDILPEGLFYDSNEIVDEN